MAESVIREYSGYLVFQPVSEAVVVEIRGEAEKYGLQVEIGNGFLEFEYSGRDTNRFVESFLISAAHWIGDAKGEITCREIREDGDPQYEFYQIADGKLLRQKGVIRRNGAEIVN